MPRHALTVAQAFGKDPRLFDRYYAAYQKFEDAAQSTTEQLARELPPGEARSKIERFDLLHKEMGVAFRNGLKQFEAAGFDVVVGDRATEGIDRDCAIVRAKLVARSTPIRRLAIDAASIASQRGNVVGEARATMTQVGDTIKHLRLIVYEIRQAGAQQSTGVAQVGEAVSQMDETTQQNAALVEQSAAAAETLQPQAAQLAECIAQFQL